MKGMKICVSGRSVLIVFALSVFTYFIESLIKKLHTLASHLLRSFDGWVG